MKSECGELVCKEYIKVKKTSTFIDKKIYFETHIHYIINKASKKLGFIQRYSRNFKDASILLYSYIKLL